MRASVASAAFGALLTCGVIAACSPARDAREVRDVNLPGVETSELTPREKREFSLHVTELLAPCPEVAVPVSQCVLEKRACARCLPAARTIAKAVREGLSPDQVEAVYKNRYDPSTFHALPEDGSPARGPENAPVTIVEFADFECPACERMFTALEKVIAARANQVRFVYKFLPLSMHPHAEPAARAAIAAGEQGKFWEMHHALFSNFGRLDQSDFERHATDLRLDLAKFKADMASAKTTARIARDRELAVQSQVAQTPTIFVNGHAYDYKGGIDEWVDAELAEAK